MTSKKINVAVVCGGRSGEHEVSLVSGCSVARALDPDRFHVKIIGISPNGRWILLNSEKILSGALTPEKISFSDSMSSMEPKAFPSDQFLKDESIDVVFPVLHGPFGEDGTIQGLLELANIPYVGSGVLGSSVGMDKDVSRRLLEHAGIPCVPTLYFRKNEGKSFAHCAKESLEKFGFPYFVKPANMGSSVGVHKVKCQSDAQNAFEDAFSYDNKILVEKGIPARELEVAVLDGHPARVSCVGEIIPHHEFYSYQAKYKDENGASLEIPAEVSEKTRDEIQTLARRAFQVLELNGLARVDFFMDKNDERIYLNEVNTMPGFTKISMYPKLMAASGLPYRELVGKLVDLALKRHQERAHLKTSFDEA